MRQKALTGYDNDSGMTMLRIGCMNLMLHGIDSPNFRYADTLSKGFDEERLYDVVLANPPFKGAIDAADVNPSLPAKCKKTEILFLHLFVRLLENGGRAAVIVPDGVLFGSSRAHVEARKKLIEENRLDAVVSMPSGVFRPYAGVSTAILVFTKGAATERIWFYDMEHDGFSLDDKRQKVAENDIPDLLECWKKRKDVKFQQKRAQRLADLQTQISPLKADRLEHHATIHRLKFEEVIAADGNAEKARAAPTFKTCGSPSSRILSWICPTSSSKVALPRSWSERTACGVCAAAPCSSARVYSPPFSGSSLVIPQRTQSNGPYKHWATSFSTSMLGVGRSRNQLDG